MIRTMLIVSYDPCEEWKDKTDDVMESGHSEAEMFTEADIFSCCQMSCDRTMIMIMMMRRRRQINDDCGLGEARRFQISRSIKGTHHLPQFTQKQVCHGGWNKYSSTQM